MSSLVGSHTGNQSLFLQLGKDTFALTECYTQYFRHLTGGCLGSMGNN